MSMSVFVDFAQDNGQPEYLFEVVEEFQRKGKKRTATYLSMVATDMLNNQYANGMNANTGSVITASMQASALYETGLKLYQQFQQTRDGRIGRRAYAAMLNSCQMNYQEGCEAVRIMQSQGFR